jgi:hypothetical protein
MFWLELRDWVSTCTHITCARETRRARDGLLRPVSPLPSQRVRPPSLSTRNARACASVLPSPTHHHHTGTRHVLLLLSAPLGVESSQVNSPSEGHPPRHHQPPPPPRLVEAHRPPPSSPSRLVVRRSRLRLAARRTLQPEACLLLVPSLHPAAASLHPAVPSLHPAAASLHPAAASLLLVVPCLLEAPSLHPAAASLLLVVPYLLEAPYLPAAAQTTSAAHRQQRRHSRPHPRARSHVEERHPREAGPMRAACRQAAHAQQVRRHSQPAHAQQVRRHSQPALRALPLRRGRAAPPTL